MMDFVALTAAKIRPDRCIAPETPLFLRGNLVPFPLDRE